MLKKSRILIMDEATASIDVHTVNCFVLVGVLLLIPRSPLFCFPDITIVMTFHSTLFVLYFLTNFVNALVNLNNFLRVNHFLL